MDSRTRGLKRWSWVMFAVAGIMVVVGIVLVATGVIPMTETAWLVVAGPLVMSGLVMRQLSDPAYAYRDRDDEPEA